MVPLICSQQLSRVESTCAYCACASIELQSSCITLLLAWLDISSWTQAVISYDVCRLTDHDCSIGLRAGSDEYTDVVSWMTHWPTYTCTPLSQSSDFSCCSFCLTSSNCCSWRFLRLITGDIGYYSFTVSETRDGRQLSQVIVVVMCTSTAGE